MRFFVLILLGGLLVVSRVVMAVERAPRISDREIIESLVTIKGEIQQLKGDIRRLDQRFEAVDQRLAAIDKRLDELRGFMLWGFGVTFAGIFTMTGSIVGFVLWDRRTALAPAITKHKELEIKMAAMEERTARIETFFKEAAQRDPNLAEALRHARLS